MRSPRQGPDVTNRSHKEEEEEEKVEVDDLMFDWLVGLQDEPMSCAGPPSPASAQQHLLLTVFMAADVINRASETMTTATFRTLAESCLANC